MAFLWQTKYPLIERIQMAIPNRRLWVSQIILTGKFLNCQRSFGQIWLIEGLNFRPWGVFDALRSVSYKLLFVLNQDSWLMTLDLLLVNCSRYKSKLIELIESINLPEADPLRPYQADAANDRFVKPYWVSGYLESRWLCGVLHTVWHTFYAYFWLGTWDSGRIGIAKSWLMTLFTNQLKQVPNLIN